MVEKRRMIETRIPIIMWSAVMLTFSMIAGTLFLSAFNANKIAAASSQTMIVGAFESVETEMEDLVIDYSVWDAAYDGVSTRDLDWIYDNMSSGVLHDLFDLNEFYWPSDDLRVSWAEETGPEVQPGAFPEAMVHQIRDALNAEPVGEYATRVFYAEVGGQTFVVAASRVEPEDPSSVTDPGNLPINLMARALSSDFLDGLGARFLVSDLHLTTGDADESFKLVLRDNLGSAIAAVDWLPPAPGFALMKVAAVPLAFLFVIFLSLSMAVGRSAQASAQALLLSEEKASRLARTDNLTKLPNRLAFQEKFDGLMADTTQEVALMTTDVNGFKQVNDTLGHVAGDQLVIKLVERIVDALPNDIFFARVGGDEFALIFTGPDSEERLRGFANAMKDALEPAFYLEGQPTHISVAMGYSVRKSGGKIEAKELIRQADNAMYASKASPTAMLVRYKSEFNPQRAKELKLESALHDALEHPEQFHMVYQPILGSHGENIDFAESLVRWTSPELGEVSPADFILVAESSGLISRLTTLILNMVCADLAQDPNMTASINISPLQINDPDFHRELYNITMQHRVKPEQMVIELTEGVLVENPRGLGVSIQKLQLLGYRVALDDFGTGYSSIGYLRQMQFSILKVDRSLVQGISKNERAREILEATMRLARAIDITVLAEGVETQEQARVLEEMGFDMLQGFNFSAAVNFNDLPSRSARKKAAA
jgi:diguanylate cyclase (GGDEF)-like protein